MSAERGTESQTPAEWIGCYSTVYVSDPAEELPIEQGLRTDLPQFSSSRLDRSYFESLHTILSGKSEFEVARKHQSAGARQDAALRRLAYGLPIPYERSVLVFVCSEELCRSIAAIDAVRAADIAQYRRRRKDPVTGSALEAAETRH